MKHKPIRIDWDELEVAFSNQNEELAYYLDLVTGKVGLEGEGGEDDSDDADEHYTPPVPTQPARNDSTRAYIEPLATQTKFEWMRRFVEEITDLPAEALASFKQAVEAEDSTAAIRAALLEHADARDRWYLYRAESLRDRMAAWLDEQGVTATNRPPWSSAAG
jgi:hypothetical protein